jgi:hypothetical protein
MKYADRQQRPALMCLLYELRAKFALILQLLFKNNNRAISLIKDDHTMEYPRSHVPINTHTHTHLPRYCYTSVTSPLKFNGEIFLSYLHPSPSFYLFFFILFVSLSAFSYLPYSIIIFYFKFIFE